ncbi:MAG: hypothetical protein JW741_02200 [Sedimentisphaerales bacterium]|nr:hypothetical protein [Sedimentisphaerales bacterium]
MADTRSELLAQLSADWEEGRAVKGWTKVSWMAHQLEQLGKPAMTAAEKGQHCGAVTVEPPKP